jgi:hypothetical protein
MAYTSHHVYFEVPAWGHLTSGNALIAKCLAANEGLVVTLVVHDMIGELKMFLWAFNSEGE